MKQAIPFASVIPSSRHFALRIMVSQYTATHFWHIIIETNRIGEYALLRCSQVKRIPLDCRKFILRDKSSGAWFRT